MWKRIIIVVPLVFICWVVSFLYATIGCHLENPMSYFFKTGLGPLVVFVINAKYPVVGLLFSVPLLAGIASHPVWPKLWTGILSALCVLGWFFISMTALMIDGS